MSYLLDKKLKRKNLNKIIFIIIILFLVFYFRNPIFRGLSFVGHTIARPVLILGNGIENKFSNIGSYFYFKKSLNKENEDLKNQLNGMLARVSNYNSVLDENIKLKDILGRKTEGKEFIVASILSLGRESIYGTVVIDAGKNQNIHEGKRVFALGNIPIGRVSEVYADSSKVVLYSNPGENTEVVLGGKDVFMTAVGRGGGNFEMLLPRDFVLDIGTEIDLPGTHPYILGYVASIVSDPRDAYQKALLRSPINIFELKFVEVEK